MTPATFSDMDWCNHAMINDYIKGIQQYGNNYNAVAHI